MRKDGQPRAFLRVKLKDLYKKIQSGELSERSFKDWLMEYRIKHYIKGAIDESISNKCKKI